MGEVDLFAGPGGWDVAARWLGLEPLGIEWDAAACETRGAAGLRTLQADVAALDPLDFAPCEPLIASAPCPTFSNAGRRGAVHLTAIITRCMADAMAGRDTRAECRDEAYAVLEPIYWREEQAKDRAKSAKTARRDADMSLLVVEPLRWTLALRPARVALEQVATVQPLWNHLAVLLRSLGYSVWTGILSAERYGVPQTRKRAILMASLDGPVSPPIPTHQAYEPGVAAQAQHTLEGELLPWVSMAQALGWDGVERPAPTVTAGGAPAATLDTRTNLATWVGCGDPLELKGDDWPDRRPATTVAGDPRVFQPGGHHGEGEQSQNAVRVTLQEALILQGFPPNYPVKGSHTKQFEQVGNAVPPPLARAILSALL